ncbi:MAG: 23S rRNA (pseudouridine(1915)-N(3))-methyltransferase RlmH [Patescibacteria group bacterium]|jgi:23S rRNA (pseudouridine1915-N3)-methyltransferase
MLDITLIAVGKIKESFWRDAFEEYAKRLKPYVRLKIIELPPEPFSKSTKEKVKEIEGKRIMGYLEKQSHESGASLVYLLAERGRTFDSPTLAGWLEKNSPLVLIIGGALGFSEELYGRYPQISLSLLTFPHELARVVLMEQLYRAAAILNGKEYHY